MYDDVWSDGDENPGVSILRRILEEAKARHASAIHIEPQEDDSIRVRLRVDGRLREIAGFPRTLYGALLGRTKVMAGMDVADRRRPQSGVIRFSKEWLDTDYLVTTLPAAHGESLCLRVRARSEPLTLEDLGFSAHNLATYRALLESGGLILHAGLTGTGCGTALHAAMGELSSADLNIIYLGGSALPVPSGVTRVLIDELDRAVVLHAALDHDPDVLVVAEMVDGETARVCVDAAAAGRLVFSHLHVASAAGAIVRLVDMGIAPYLLAGCLLGVCAHRLVRRPCRACTQERQPSPEEREVLARTGDASPVSSLVRTVGCSACGGEGYSGRTGLHELLVPNQRLRRLICQAASGAELAHAAREAGMRSLVEDAIEKVKAHTTTLSEVHRALPMDAFTHSGP